MTKKLKKSMKQKVKEHLPEIVLGATTIALSVYAGVRLNQKYGYDGLANLESQWDAKLAKTEEGSTVYLDREFNFWKYTPDKK